MIRWYEHQIQNQTSLKSKILHNKLLGKCCVEHARMKYLLLSSKRNIAHIRLVISSSTSVVVARSVSVLTQCPTAAWKPGGYTRRRRRRRGWRSRRGSWTTTCWSRRSGSSAGSRNSPVPCYGCQQLWEASTSSCILSQVAFFGNLNWKSMRLLWG